MRGQSRLVVAAALSMVGFAGVASAQGNGAFLGPAPGQAPGRAGRQAPAGPSAPAPRDSSGKIILGALPGERQGLWAPGPAQIADPKDVPFLPWAKAIYDFRQTTELEPHSRCKASGGPRQFVTPYGVEIVEMKELQRLFIFDIGGPHTFRTVYLDSRTHPDHLSPTNYGHSIGWWEGDSLIIDTVGFNEDFWFERRGLPHTETLHMIERLTRTSKDAMEYRVTIDDPAAYTKPFTGGFELRFRPTNELFEYMCQQANYAHELMVGRDAQDKTINRTSLIVP
ncbi:MAG: hypothetical protein ABI811_13490 [Acidobacteriota bacterium]